MLYAEMHRKALPRASKAPGAVVGKVARSLFQCKAGRSRKTRASGSVPLRKRASVKVGCPLSISVWEFVFPPNASVSAKKRPNRITNSDKALSAALAMRIAPVLLKAFGSRSLLHTLQIPAARPQPVPSPPPPLHSSVPAAAAAGPTVKVSVASAVAAAAHPSSKRKRSDNDGAFTVNKVARALSPSSLSRPRIGSVGDDGDGDGDDDDDDEELVVVM
ncbi:uncharacterized protein AMSG_05501 [Thecamonas trahens ATCC 50062]|uniref:Uncharacterized protein n=1 Tax=Thecamonas trahens ATCC 50062 TaxID=461836 RepID=A0A0L0DB59_THETB|nr:hypothetical protein AMSG_05501 [Thecamonas trahens ATCC 50062]KNC49485.1 hypothetical protein AMSG_05501 [Thecamonas trahens ATCC 50062]|eukprot:XP_013757904.1 hypothetical protein AMSG_05501 [Thecamonas trahens ATCC 50062]